MKNKKQHLLMTLKQFKESSLAIQKAVASLEDLIGCDVFYEASLWDAIKRTRNAAYEAVEAAYELPYGDIEWLESIGWIKDNTPYHIEGKGLVILESLEDYVEKVCEA